MAKPRKKVAHSQKAPAARSPRRREAKLEFEGITIEGGLLSPDWLTRAAQLSAGHQSEADYRVPKGLNLRDEIGRYWRIAQAHWAELQAGRSHGGDLQALSERFVPALLREAFGFGSLPACGPVTLDGRTHPIGFSALEGRVPVVVAAAGSGLDTLSPRFGDGGRRRSAFGLAQEFLNAAERALWGIACDGLTLRILRDNASLTRPAWIEASLERIFVEERYPDFAALWLLAHETRFGKPDQPVTECALEAWREAARAQGTAARGKLREGVESALLALGNGFLAHPDNGPLREALRTNALTTAGYFNELLRLVYRMIFLLTVEERGLLHPEGAPEGSRHLYEQAYGLKRLRERSVRRSAHDRHKDLWEALKLVFRGLATGESRLALPALAGIFASGQCPHLDLAMLSNAALLSAVFKLSWLRESGGLSRVNWRDMGPEELGSVYESLLELVPRVTQGGRAFEFATGDETKGNARKTTGSYYTPDSLVQVLLDTALEPVVAQTLAAHPANGVEALLKLSVVDPACGSGHFLLAAARRLAAHVARLQAHGTPSAAEYRRAVRQVVGRCIFGVDLNPLAVELCKVSLWMEAVEPGLPLGFLDSHIQQGNALLGTSPELMAQGIPEGAWNPLEGDERAIANALRARNRREATEQQQGMETLWSAPAGSESAQVTRAVLELETVPDSDAATLAQKESQWEAILVSEAYRHQRFVADAWCAAFVWPKRSGEVADAAPTNELWRQLRDGRGAAPAVTRETTEMLAGQYGFLHWHLAFPQVFAKGGFDVVLGNPPWEHVELKEEEWFSERSPTIANAPNAAARKRMIAALETDDPVLFRSFCDARRRFEAENQLARESGRFPLCARGRINTYALFAEHNRAVLGAKGRAGFIVPAGLVTDDGTKAFFNAASEAGLVSVFHFENEGRIFPEVHHAFRFLLLTLGQSARSDLLFFARSTSDLSLDERHFSLAPADFELLNPNTRTCPTFRSRRDADLNLTIYRRAGILWREGVEGGNPWDLRFMQGLFNMASDSELFRTEAQLVSDGATPHGNHYLVRGSRMLPLVEAKMVQHFDHRFGSYEGQTEAQANQGKLPEFDDLAHADPGQLTRPRYWVDQKEVEERLVDAWSRGWLLGWRDITGTEKRRTIIASLIPRIAVGHTTPLLFSDCSPTLIGALYANLCSFILDYAARQKVGGTHLTYGYLKQLPVLAPAAYEVSTPWEPRTLVRDWILKRVLELTYTAWDLESFARDVGYEGPPFRWDAGRRFLLRAELDAAFFHLYSLSREDTAYVLDTFPIVRKNDEKTYGEYRTQRVILERYDAMAEAVRTRAPYVTPLDPPPADPRVSHLSRSVA